MLDELLFRQRMTSHLQVCGVPRQVWEEIVDYLLLGHPLGEFLTAVFSNHLMAAVKAADELHFQRLRDYITFMECCAPALCWGSPNVVDAWKRLGGFQGQYKARLKAIGTDPTARSVE
jgi:hypothetical protein